MLENLVLITFVLVNVPLGVAVYKNNPKSATNRLFAFLVFLLTIYLVISDRMYAVSDFNVKLGLARLIMVNAAFINLGVVLFLTTFPENTSPIGKVKNVILWSSTILLSIAAATPLITQTIEVTQDNIITPIPGILMPLFGIHTAGFVLGGLIKTLLKYRKVSGLNKTKIRYIFLAFVLLFFFILTFNFVLPAFFGIGFFAPFLPLYILIFLLIVSYAIVKHSLLELRLLVARSVVYTLVVFIITALYAVSVLVVGWLLFPNLFNIQMMSVSLLMTIIVAFSFPWIRSHIETLTNRIFYKHDYNVNYLMNELTKMMAETLNLEDLLRKLQNRIEKGVQISKSGFILKDNQNGNNMISVGNDFKLSYEYFKKMLQSKRTIVFEDLSSNSPLYRYMKDKNIFLIVPISTKEHGNFGLYCLGSKKSGDIFYSKDIEFLEIFGRQSSVAIENAMAYEEIQAFAEVLKQKVKEATHKLSDANEKLKIMDKRKDEFLNVAAHELRAPLTAVKGYLSMIMDGDAGKVNNNVQHFLSGALTGAEREVRLVNNMLNMSRIEENRLVFKVGKVSLGEVVDQVFMEFKIQAEEKGLKIVTDIEKGIKDKVKVDEDRIHEVVANFVSNAVKYTDQGEVTIKMFNKKIDGKPWVRVEVIDSGYGMTESEQKKLFTKFYRAESSAGKVLGTGLGLYITKLLIDKFDGNLGLSSEKRKGSTFWFELKVVR